MKTMMTATGLAALMLLGACGGNADDKAADNIEAMTDQYSCATNVSISRSRSTSRRSATDWTRPAERAPGSLRQRTGESVKPTR